MEIEPQISSVVYRKIQRRQVIMNVLHPGSAQLPQWSTPVLWRRFEDGLASICVLIHSCAVNESLSIEGSAVDAAAAATDINVLAPSTQYLSQTLTLTPVYSPRELSQTRISSRHYKTAVQVHAAQQPSIHPADSETNRPSESNFLGMPHSFVPSVL